MLPAGGSVAGGGAEIDEFCVYNDLRVGGDGRQKFIGSAHMDGSLAAGDHRLGHTGLRGLILAVLGDGHGIYSDRGLGLRDGCFRGGGFRGEGGLRSGGFRCALGCAAAGKRGCQQ